MPLWVYGKIAARASLLPFEVGQPVLKGFLGYCYAVLCWSLSPAGVQGWTPEILAEPAQGEEVTDLLAAGDISSVPNLSLLHLSWEQLIPAASSSKRRRKSCSTVIPIRCCDSCHLLAGPGWLSLGTGLGAHRESPKQWGLFGDIKDHSGYLFCYGGKMIACSFFI